jgi:hypothetical protein
MNLNSSQFDFDSNLTFIIQTLKPLSAHLNCRNPAGLINRWQPRPHGPNRHLQQATIERLPSCSKIADFSPGPALAPPAGDRDLNRLQERLGFVDTEIHKDLPVSHLWYANDAAKASARERIGKNVSIAAADLETRKYVGGERFTVAHAFLAWALLRLKFGGLDAAGWPPLVTYLDRLQQRPQVKAAIELEQQLGKTLRRKAVGPPRAARA